MKDGMMLPLRRMSIDMDRIPADSYLWRISAVCETTEIEFHSPVTFFAGENGTGKSTLIEAIAIACGFNPEGGTRNYHFSTYDSHAEFWRAIRLVRSPAFPEWGYFLRAESFYNVATMEEEYARDGPGGESARYHERSHGESFLELMNRSLGSRGFFLLDEPEAALSPQRQLTLLSLIHESVKDGSQFLIATHSPILLGYPDAEILSFDQAPVSVCSYEDTQSYQITSLFLQDRKRIFYNLFRSDEETKED